MTSPEPSTSTGIHSQVKDPLKPNNKTRIAHEIFEKYKNWLAYDINLTESTYRGYEENPEEHPQYAEEWRIFYEKRYRELATTEGSDPVTHDYKPEWVDVWMTRMQELKIAEFESREKGIRIKLGMTKEDKNEVTLKRKAEPLPPKPHCTRLHVKLSEDEDEADEIQRIPTCNPNKWFKFEYSANHLRNCENNAALNLNLSRIDQVCNILESEHLRLNINPITTMKIINFRMRAARKEEEREGSSVELFGSMEFLEFLENVELYLTALIRKTVNNEHEDAVINALREIAGLRCEAHVAMHFR